MDRRGVGIGRARAGHYFWDEDADSNGRRGYLREIAVTIAELG